MRPLKTVLAEREQVQKQLQEMLAPAKTEQRALTNVEKLKYDGLMAKMVELREEAEEIQRLDAEMAKHAQLTRHDEDEGDGGNGTGPRGGYGGYGGYSGNGESVGNAKIFRPDENLARKDQHQRRALEEGLRAFVTGDGSRLRDDVVLRDHATTPGSAGGYTITDELAATVIDLARSQAVCVRAGARTLPMTSESLVMARIKTDPTPGWTGENQPLPNSEGSFGMIRLTPRKLGTYVKISRELMQDAGNGGSAILNSLTQALALELDRVCLFGSGNAGEPRGLANYPEGEGLNILDMGTDGAAISNYAKFTEALGRILSANGPMEGLGLVLNPREYISVEGFEDLQNQPLRPPTSFEKHAKFISTQVPTNRVKGSSTDASVAILGNFAEMVIGVRRQIELVASDIPGFASDQIWIKATLRADVTLLKPAHFCVIDGIVPAG